jgi:acetylornithine deacetylase/succinyl-diaminopimelate desuccinylase-like protein
MSELRRRAWCLGLGLLALAASARAASGPGDSLDSYLARHAPSIVEEFVSLLSIPNLSSDASGIRANAEAVKALLERRAVRVRLLEGGDGPPLVYGEKVEPGVRRTVLFYAHYDGQPVHPERWASDPWKPVLRDGRLEDGGEVVAPEAVRPSAGSDFRLYARSVADDKAPIMALAAALDFLRSDARPLSVNVKFLFEGEEEAGSPHLRSLLEEYKDLLRSDALFICDGPVDQSGRMQLTFGARGTLGLEMTVYGPNHPLHSGHYGNWAPNPAALLANLLAGLRDDDGRVLVQGFYDRVRPISDEDRKAIRDLPDSDGRLRREYGLAWTESSNARLAERILRPALNLRGLESGAVGAGAANAIPPQARASIDFRLVPDQSPEEVKRLVEAHIRARGFHPVAGEPRPEDRLATPRLIRLQWEDGYPPYRLSLDDPFGRAAARTLAGALPEPPLRLPALGGSVPMKMFADILDLPVLGLPIANYDNNQHGPNENLRLRNLWDGIALFAALFSSLGADW